MRQLLLFIVFAAAIGGLCYAAANPVAAPAWAAPLAARSNVAARIEADLQKKAAAALAARGLEWASVKMEGQTAILEGEAPREEERAEAIAALLGAAGRGGVLEGGVVQVKSDRSTIAAPVSPYEWRAVRTGARVSLIGATPTRSSRAELVDYAGRLFTGGVVDEMRIARGAPDETAWLAVARTAIAQVALLEDGKATLRDDQLTIEGRAPEAVTRERVTAAISQLPDPFIGAARVEAPDFPAAPAPTAARAGAGAAQSLEPITDLGVCRDVFRTLLNGKRIDFAEGLPSIAKESYPLLDSVVIAALRCDGMSFTVRGAGDPKSTNDEYVELGAKRAGAIMDYFILKGVPQDRIVAQPRARSGDLRSTAPLVEFVVNR